MEDLVCIASFFLSLTEQPVQSDISNRGGRWLYCVYSFKDRLLACKKQHEWREGELKCNCEHINNVSVSFHCDDWNIKISEFWNATYINVKLTEICVMNGNPNTLITLTCMHCSWGHTTETCTHICCCTQARLHADSYFFSFLSWQFSEILGTRLLFIELPALRLFSCYFFSYFPDRAWTIKLQSGFSWFCIFFVWCCQSCWSLPSSISCSTCNLDTGTSSY